MNIEWISSPNYSSRNEENIITIVNHITAGSYPGCLTWLQNPVSQASAHYLITKTGLIFQLVKEENKAWHAGIVNKPNWSLYDGKNPNNCTLGIEHENLSGGELTELQYQATLWLHKNLINKYSIPIDENHIIGHYRIDSVNRPNCPGPNFPWNRLFKDLLKGDDNMIRYEKINDIPDWGKNTINKLITKNALSGDGKGNINLSEDMLRILVINDRLGIYDK